MHKGRLVAGIVCLAVAALLTVANLRLPADEVMFTVGDQNMPWVPPAVLGIVGIGLLATIGVGAPGVESGAPRAERVVDPNKAALNQRLEMIGWGLFLVMLGGFWLVPHTTIAKGFWSIGIGVIMLGLNAARYLLKIKMSGFTTFLGIISLVGGILQLMGLKAIEGAFLLIILGAFLLVKPWFDRRQLFGKAEEA